MLSPSMQLQVVVALLGIALGAMVIRHPERSAVFGFALAPYLPLYMAYSLPFASTQPLLAWWGLLIWGGAYLCLILRRIPSPGPFPMLLDVSVLAKNFQSNIVWSTLVSGFTLTQGLRNAIFLGGMWFLPAVVMGRLGRSRIWVERLFQAMVLSAVLQALLALLEKINFNLMAFLLDHVTLLRFFLVSELEYKVYQRMDRFGMIRAQGTFHESIDLGWYFGLVLLLMIGGWQFWGRGIPNRARVLLVGLVAAGLLTTLSGTPFLATVVGFAVLLLLLPGVTRLRVVVVLSVLVLLGLLLAYMIPRLSDVRLVVEAFLQVENEVYLYEGVGPNTQGRLMAYAALWPLVMESPVWGHGNFLQRTGAVSLVRDITSRYMIELIEGGFIGLFFFLLPVGLALAGSLHARFRSHDIWIQTLSATLVAVLAQCLVMDFVKNNGGVVETYYWMTIGLAFTLSTHMRLQLRSEAGSTRTW